MFKMLFALGATLSPTSSAAATSWMVSDDPEELCIASQSYEGSGETVLTIASHHKEALLVTIANSNWSSREGERYKISFLFDNERVFSGPGFGANLGGKAGINASINADIINQFSRSSSVSIFLDERLMDSLALRGSAAALARVENCLIRKARISAKQRLDEQRLEHIPRDPFAKP